MKGLLTQLGLWGDDNTPWADRMGASSTVRRPGAAGALPVESSLASAPSCNTATVDWPRFLHPQAEREIVLGKARVAYEIKRVRRRSIGMVVGVDGLSVRAPKWVSVSDIESALLAKERWICAKLVEQRERAQRQTASRIEWCDGANVPYLGEPLTLVLDETVSGVLLREGPMRALHLGLPLQASSEQIRDVTQAWLQQQARALFSQRVPIYAARLGVAVRKVSLSSARTRWGSASADGSVRLHWRLVHFSTAIVDYVVAHELAHLREMNHSPRFWEVVRSVMPEFDAPRAQLRAVTIPE